MNDYNECYDVLLHKFHLTKPTVKSLLNVIQRHFKKGDNSAKVFNICRDLNDNQLFADALINKVEVILCGYKDLLSNERYEGIRVIGPKDYWKFKVCLMFPRYSLLLLTSMIYSI